MPGLSSNARPLKAARFIPKGELFTQFGGHTLQKQNHPLTYRVFEALRQKLNNEPGRERLQYTVKDEGAFWIPPNDQPLIKRSSASLQLKALLTPPHPPKCTNAEISPMIILRDEHDQNGECRDLQGIALRTTRDT